MVNMFPFVIVGQSLVFSHSSNLAQISIYYARQSSIISLLRNPYYLIRRPLDRQPSIFRDSIKD